VFNDVQGSFSCLKRVSDEVVGMVVAFKLFYFAGHYGDLFFLFSFGENGKSIVIEYGWNFVLFPVGIESSNERSGWLSPLILFAHYIY
jgi:hypothetical protein